jgi:hypothetical protein
MRQIFIAQDNDSLENGCVPRDLRFRHGSCSAFHESLKGDQAVRRDINAMIYWALRWHEGRQVPDEVLYDVLWGEFALKPKDPAASLRELMPYVQKRHGDKWDFQDCGGKAFRILPRSDAPVADFDRGRVRSGVGRVSGRTSQVRRQKSQDTEFGRVAQR